MLHNASSRADDQNPPSSPIRRLVEPSHANSTDGAVSNAEFVTSTPATQVGHGIKKEAFSPNYFKRFFIEEKELGRGGKGVVLLVRHELDGVSLGQFACKRVPVGDDHAWLEKGKIVCSNSTTMLMCISPHRSPTFTRSITPKSGILSPRMAGRR
jgi:hypothetical protein